MLPDEAIEDDRACRLNIGAGNTFIPDFTNIDIARHADISLDLNVERLPFQDNSVDVVFSYHTLEHLKEYLFALGEIHRVMRHGGQLLLGVPYVTLTMYNLVNPYHKQNFNEFSFDFFDSAKLLGSAAEEGSIVFKKAFHRFHYMPEFADKSEAEKDYARMHLFNVVQKIDFGLIAVKHGGPRVAIDDMLALNMTDRFDALLASRKPYPPRKPA